MKSSIKLSEKYFSKKIIKKYNSHAYTTIISHDKIINDVAFKFLQKEDHWPFYQFRIEKLLLCIRS